MSNNDRMTWEEKLQAIKCISPNASLWMNKPGDWCVSGAPGVIWDLVPDRGNISFSGHFGTSPENAVNNLWAKVTTLGGQNYLCDKDDWSRRYRWKEFMWIQIPLTKEADPQSEHGAMQ